MKINNVNLIGFGKFKNKEISFKDGINIVYAENEGGKTTIHNFIYGMFYGLLKPYVKSTIYLPEHKKYDPWERIPYKGSLSLSIEDKVYRIERDFTKGREETKVYLDNTGEDITGSINNGENGRILQPGYHFFHFNSGIYTNTISIKQLGSVTEEKLANELRDKLINLSTAMDEKISVETAVNELDKKIKNIGTGKASSSQYSLLLNEIDLLKEERIAITKKQSIYNDLLNECEKLNIMHLELENLLDIRKSEEKVALYKEKKELYNEALKEIKNIENLKDKLDKYTEYKALSSEDFSQAQEIQHDINIINNRIEDTTNLLDDIKEVMHHLLVSKMNFDEVEEKELSRDFFHYETLEDEKIRLESSERNNSIEFLKRDQKDIKKELSKFNVLKVVLFISYLIGMYFTINNKMWVVIGLLQIIWIPEILVNNNVKRIKSLLSRIEQQCFLLEQEETVREKELKSLVEAQNQILQRNGVAIKQELRDKQQKMQQLKYKYEDELKSIEDNKVRISAMNNKLQELNIKKQTLEYELKELLIKNNSKDLEQFKIGLQYKNIFEDYSIEYRNREEILGKILGNNNMEELKLELDKNSHLDIDYNFSRDDLKATINELSNELNLLALEKNRYQTQLDGLIPSIASLVDIEEEITRKSFELQRLDRKREALELAKTTILKLSKEIHSQFAPHINERVGTVLSKITDGKYSSVRIDNLLNVGVINPITKEIVDVNSLSSGTIDQLYFSLRFGIINSISEKALPLILDDCFVQYDDSRLSNIMRLLLDISKKRQIILFSCHHREVDILQKLGESFNLIALS